MYLGICRSAAYVHAALACSLLATTAPACGGSGQSTSEPTRTRPNASVDESSGARIVSRTAPIPAAAAPNERIVFVRAGSIWMMGADGENPEQLTVRSLEAEDQGPQVSPTGSQLAYASAKDGTLRLYLQSMEDMIPAAISEGIDSQPAWSPDGQQLAYMHGDERVDRDLYILDIAGERAPRLVVRGDDDHPEQAGAPTWSRDGSFLVVGADRREHLGTSLWRVDAESGALQRLTPNPGGDEWICDKSPSLSPDGKRIAFASNRHNSSADSADDFDIYTVKIDGSGLTRLTDDPGTTARPVYSTDGSRIYFASTRIRKADFEWELFVMAASGGEQRRLTRDARPENYAPSVTSLPSPE